jgi:capsular polysaccharide biosynthesis protein
MRSVVWANLGVLAEPSTHRTAPLVLFVRSDGASNHRRIVNEAALAASVRAVLAESRPQWRFRHQAFESLTYANELRLLRSVKVLIALYSASLTNCQFLPPGAIVLQIHGALRGEIERADTTKYARDYCNAALGLRWAGFLAAGWNRTYPDEADHPDFTNARVDPAAFGAFVRRAIVDEDFDGLKHEYHEAVRRDLHLAGRTTM